FPELLMSLYSERDRTEGDRFNQLALLLNELTTRLNEMPVPWGLKWISEARGISEARFAQPLSAQRIIQGMRFKESFIQWASKPILTDARGQVRDPSSSHHASRWRSDENPRTV